MDTKLPAKSILVIDDEPSIGRVVQFKLQQEGFKVRVATDGLEGLAYMKEEKPDLILLDLMMPGMDGFEVCRRLRAAPETVATPVIILTARGQEMDRIRGLELGVLDFFTKPFSPQKLLERVKEVFKSP
jgi:two-component system alkaline phosphatase synthesis response regulator PhoP